MFILVEVNGFDIKYATIVTDEDGENIIFESWEDADEYSKNNLQNGIIVPL